LIPWMHKEQRTVQLGGCSSTGKGMTRLPLNLPPEVAKRFMRDMRAFLAEPKAIKRDEIAARQLHALNQHLRPRDRRLRLVDMKELFQLMREK
jgi:hypothetical protein